MTLYPVVVGGTVVALLGGCAAGRASSPSPTIDLKAFDCATSACAAEVAAVTGKPVLYPRAGTAKDYIASTSYQVGHELVHANNVQLVYTSTDGTTYVLSGWDGAERGRSAVVAPTPSLSPVTVRDAAGSWQQDEQLTEVSWTEGSWHWALSGKTTQTAMLQAAGDLTMNGTTSS